MLGALAQALPDRVPAAGEGGNTVLSIGGLTADRRPFVIVDMITGAWGGAPGQGRHGGGDQPLAEHVEHAGGGAGGAASDPHRRVRLRARLLRAPAAGAAASACARRYTLLNDEATLQLRSDRMRFLPYGLDGGGARARHAERPQPGHRGARDAGQVRRSCSGAAT